MISSKAGQITKPIPRIVPRYYPSRPLSTSLKPSLSKSEEGNKWDEARRQEEKMREDWLKIKPRLTGLGGVVIGAAGAYGLSQLAQEYKEEKERIRKEVLAAEVAQHQEQRDAFLAELQKDPLYGPAFNFSYLPPLYRSYVLKKYKNRIIQEGLDIAQFIAESDFNDVLFLSQNNLEKRYDLWEKLLDRSQPYLTFATPEQLAQVEHEWLNTGLSVEDFLATKQETSKEKQIMTNKYKNIFGQAGWTGPSWIIVENALPGSTKNLIKDYKSYINLWEKFGPRELEILKLRTRYIPKIIQRYQMPTAEPLKQESPNALPEELLTAE